MLKEVAIFCCVNLYKKTEEMKALHSFLKKFVSVGGDLIWGAFTFKNIFT